MRLYRMELYKLCHRKSVAAGFLFVLLIGIFFFYDDVKSQSCTVEDTTYHSFDAIRMDRQITEQFRGELTEEKMKQIIAQYGFPQGIPDQYYNRLPGNFLNSFVMEYASDGYNHGQDDYRIATRLLPFADTPLGRSYAAAGIKPRLEYYYGWRCFLEKFGALLLCLNVLILYTVSTVFAKEEQDGTKPLLFTTKKGPAEDALAKIATAFSVSVVLWLLTVSFYLLLSVTVYGADGLHCICALVVEWGIDTATPLMQQSIGAYLAETLLVSLLAVLELCAVTLCVSARCRGSFHAVTGAGVCYVLPFLGFLLLQSGTSLMMILSVKHPLSDIQAGIAWRFFYLLRSISYASPVYLSCCRDVLVELSRSPVVGRMGDVYITLAIAVSLSVLCTFLAWRQYRKVTKS